MVSEPAPKTQPEFPFAKRIRRVRCINPFIRCEINEGLAITPCCEYWCKTGLAELKSAELADVWNSTPYRALRRQMLPGGDPTYFCDASRCPELLNDSWYDLEENPLSLPPELIDEIAEGKTRIENGPLLIQLTNDFRCNLRCVMCSARDRLGHGDDDALQAFEKVKGCLHSIRELFMLGSGEVFAHGALLDALERLDGRNYPNTRLSFFSNGTLITPRRWRKLDTWAVRVVNVSVDGASRETYERIRQGARWDDLLSAIRFLRSERDRGRFTDLHVNMTVMRSNCHEVAALAHRALEWGADLVFFRWVHSYTPETILSPLHWTSIKRLDAQLADPVFNNPRVVADHLFKWPNFLSILPLSSSDRKPGATREPLGHIHRRILRAILSGMHLSALGTQAPDAVLDKWDARFDELREASRDGRQLPEQVGVQLFSSEAYRARRRSHAEFAGDLYRVLLRREAGPDELAYWEGQAASRDPIDLVNQFVASEEFREQVMGVFRDGADFPPSGAGIPARITGECQG